MGPILLVDKSFLQSLNHEEATALHRHYSILVTPMLLREILADLVKADYSPDEALRRVIGLVVKTDGFDAFTVTDARAICLANLDGEDIPLDGRIPRFGGREVTAADGSKGIVFDETLEQRLMRTWRSGQLSETDKRLAAQFRAEVDNFDPHANHIQMKEQFPKNAEYKSLDEIAEFVDRCATQWPDQWAFIEIATRWPACSKEQVENIRTRWERAGRPPFSSFARYAYFSHRVFQIYFLAVTAGKVDTTRAGKTLFDVIYFQYLPFCHAFCSGDKFHRDFFQYAARSGQDFIWAPELKKDLAAIASFHRNLNEKDRILFAREFGSYPPPIPGSITRDIWLNHMRPWTPGSGNRVAGLSPEENKKAFEELKKQLGPDFF